METMDFADVFNAISAHMDSSGESWVIRGLEASPDLTNFRKQETDMALFPVEYIDQRGCGDYGYHGTIYFPTIYSDGDGGVLHLLVEFSE
jgi:hypothetical protein